MAGQCGTLFFLFWQPLSGTITENNNAGETPALPERISKQRKKVKADVYVSAFTFAHRSISIILTKIIHPKFDLLLRDYPCVFISAFYLCS